MTIKRKRSYSKEFKERAVEMLIYGKKSTKEVSRELGVPVPNLIRWRREVIEQSGASGKTLSKGLDPASMEQEIRKLKRALEQVELERDILKKTVSIFSQPNRNA